MVSKDASNLYESLGAIMYSLVHVSRFRASVRDYDLLYCHSVDL